MKDIRTQSAIIIQRNFRLYLNKQGEHKIAQANDEQEGASTCKLEEQGRSLNSNTKKCGEGDAPIIHKFEEIHSQINDVYDGIDSFYKSLPKSFDRGKYIDNILNDIEEMLDNLKNISTLEDCEKVPTTEISEDACKKHEESLKKSSVKWWDTLNEQH